MYCTVTVAPTAFGGNRPVLVNSAHGAVISGASPVVNGTVPVNQALQPLRPVTLTVDTGNELIMSSA